jgi:hypothetical protein
VAKLDTRNIALWIIFIAMCAIGSIMTRQSRELPAGREKPPQKELPE